ncbi:uncharacterized protein [Diadema setosum]|uniref:uncharacterized protein n=1 Tax=Diadema setosum TaxID=31175 RepID=UPI003B3B36F1
MPQFSSSLFTSFQANTSNQFDCLADDNNSDGVTDQTSSLHYSPGHPIASSSPITTKRKTGRVNKVKQNLRVLNINFQSVRNKKAEIGDVLDSTKPDIVLGTETWLKENITSSELFPDGYTIVRRDRSDGYGGVLIALKENIIFEQLSVEEAVEAILVKIPVTGNKYLLVGVIYRPPSSGTEYMDMVCNVIEKIHSQHPNAVLWLGGDLNLPDINWETQTTERNQYPSAICHRFLEMLQNCCLHQTVDFPTRFNTCLDLFLTNRPSLVSKCAALPGIGDHDIVSVESSISINRLTSWTLDIHTILSDVQHGFRKKRPCTSQLTLAIHDLAKGIDNREQIDVILLDFSKAFDKVPHSRLLYKLDYYGIRGTLHNWLADFLHNRTQRVILEGSISSSVNIASGVPQGSVIVPLLFLLFINDMPECLSTDCTVRLFADDCMIYKTIKSEADAHILQQNLDALQCWETDWLMQFNPNKCKVLHLTNKRKPLLNSYNIHGQPLANTNTAKYLGIHIQNNLSWNHHINQVAKKANSTSAFLQRNIHACPRKIKVLCYLTLLRPIMEYASIIWDPFTQVNINRLEMVQRRYVRFVFHDYQRTSSVTDMLHTLGWP